MKAWLLVVALLVLPFVAAHGAESFAQAQSLIAQNASCSTLSEEQLEMIGDYYMEQMHPGEAHEMMDAMHGGEGSLELGQMHTAMARNIYCDGKSGFSAGRISRWYLRPAQALWGIAAIVAVLVAFGVTRSGKSGAR